MAGMGNGPQVRTQHLEGGDVLKTMGPIQESFLTRIAFDSMHVRREEHLRVKLNRLQRGAQKCRKFINMQVPNFLRLPQRATKLNYCTSVKEVCKKLNQSCIL